MEAGDSFFDDNLSDYSDDFEDDESSVRAHHQVPPPPIPPLDVHSTSTPRRVNQHHERSFAERANRTDPIFRKAKSQYLSGRKGTKMNRSSVKGKGRAASEMKASAFKQGSMFSPRDRELSAKRHTIKKLESSLSEAKRELTDLKKENRLLNRLQIRQEKEITRFQTQEGELPEILSRHAEEVRALKEQLRRSQESSHTHQQKVNELHQELLRVNNRKKKLEEVAKRKHLLEREKLTLQLQDTHEQLQSKEKRICELERGIEAMSKNHSQEVRSLMLKNKALSNEAEDLRHTSQRIHAQLKEKEREMDVLNIYTQRLGKNIPPRIATKTQAPVTESVASQTTMSCPPSKSVSLQTKPGLKTSGSQTDLPLPGPPVSVTAASTQTDRAATPKVENKEVSNAPPALAPQPVPKPVAPLGGGSTVPVDGRSTPPKASTAGVEEPQESLQQKVEEQKKMDLIATLRAMDAQKDPPASHPVPSVAVKSRAQPTTNVTVGGERVIEKTAKQAANSQQPAASAKTGEDNAEDEAKKKKLLLAKLMAIDEGSDPSKVTISKMDVSKGSQPSPKHSASGHKSTTSIQSWPETVENMYNGKPAFAKDDDPFGSRHSSGKRDASTTGKGFFLTEGDGEGAKAKRHGRRHQLEQKSSSDFNTDALGRSNKVAAKVATEHVLESTPPTATAQTQLAGYQPSFGRRAGGANGQPTKPKNGMIFGDLDNFPQPPAKKTEPPSSLALNFGTEKGEESRGSSRDYPWESRVNVSMNSQRAGREREVETNKNDAGPLSSPSMIFGYVGQPRPLLESGSKGALLPLREKKMASPMPTNSYDIHEPDDLEELAL